MFFRWFRLYPEASGSRGRVIKHVTAGKLKTCEIILPFHLDQSYLANPNPLTESFLKKRTY